MLAPLFTLNGFAFAALHIIIVSALAPLLGWGFYSFKNSVWRLPGGTIMLQIPSAELLLFFMVQPQTDQAALVFSLVQHFLRIRLIFLTFFGIPAFIKRYLLGGLVVECFDGRLEDLMFDGKSKAANHFAACGGFDSLTLMGTMPGMLIVAPIVMLRIALPGWLVGLGMVPWFFILAKLGHWAPAMFVSDLWQEITEEIGHIVYCIVFMSEPVWQKLPYKKHTN